jgi:FkbM family methyltransferase
MSLLDSLKFITTHPLNRGCEFRSILRFAKWQIGSRLLGGSIVHDWVGGARFLVRTGETGLTGNIYTGLHEFAEMGYLLHVLRESDVFVDVGANVGSYTILACAAVGAQVFAFEPSPEAYRRLVENVRLNGAEARATCLNLAVGRSEGVLRFTIGLDTINHVAASGDDGANVIEVRVGTLDAALADVSPCVAKIDVEGFEMPALEGARKTLGMKSLHSVIMELNGSGSRYGYDETSIMHMMSDYGFGTYSYDPVGRKLLNLGGKNLASGNTLFIRDRDFVTQRIATAPNVSVFGKSF